MHQAAHIKRGYRWILFTAAILAGLLLIPNSLIHAQNRVLPGSEMPEKLELVSGKSVLLRLEQPINRVSIASPDTASYLLLSPREIYITGKAAGSTNLILWKEDDTVEIFDLVVSYDIPMLKQAIHDMLPHETDLRITAARDSITLSGRVTSQSDLSQALSLARSFVPEGRVNNLVEVGGAHQVMLEIRVAEMQKSMARRLGVNFSYADRGEFGVSTLGGLTQTVSPSDANIPPARESLLGTLVSPTVNALFRIESGRTKTYTGMIDVLKENGLVKVLAEPTLIAMSGQSAEFLAGGEFPVPVPQGLGTVAVEYRQFGVGLSFTPTVLGPDRISLQVAPEVSELDFSTAVRFEGFVVPGVTSRKASTTIELADGQSFAIAGLLRETARDQYSRYPVLGKLPIIGPLFTSRQFQQNETELVIIATPRLVKPIDGRKQPVPTDFYNMPDDKDFYLLGNMEGKPRQQETPRGEFDGEFGHAVPED